MVERVSVRKPEGESYPGLPPEVLDRLATRRREWSAHEAAKAALTDDYFQDPRKFDQLTQGEQ